MGYIATRGANKQRPLLFSIAAPSDLYCDLYGGLYCALLDLDLDSFIKRAKRASSEWRSGRYCT